MGIVTPSLSGFMKLAIKCQDILFVDDLLDDLKAGSNKCVQPLLQNASGNKPRGREAPIFCWTIGNLTPSFGGRLNPSSSRYPRHSLGAVTSVTPAPVADRGRARERCVQCICMTHQHCEKPNTISEWATDAVMVTWASKSDEQPQCSP